MGTVAFLALKKTGFSEKKNSSQKKIIFFLPFFYATFQCGRYNVFNFFFFFFFSLKKLKKRPPKVAHNRPKPFFPQPSPSHSQQPKIDFSYHKDVWSRPLCTYSGIFSPKKSGFSEKKNSSQQKNLKIFTF